MARRDWLLSINSVTRERTRVRLDPGDVAGHSVLDDDHLLGHETLDASAALVEHGDVESAQHRLGGGVGLGEQQGERK